MNAPTFFTGKTAEDFCPACTFDTVEAWRYEQLVTAGADDFYAQVIATTRRVDLHEAIALIERGCDGETAARILL